MIPEYQTSIMCLIFAGILFYPAFKEYEEGAGKDLPTINRFVGIVSLLLFVASVLQFTLGTIKLVLK